jgi:glycosyltransferase involved in cell wall biosynthesis
VKVAHIIAPSPVGGAEQVVLDLTGALCSQGLEVHLIVVLDEGSNDRSFLTRVDEGIHVHPLLISARRYDRERKEIRSILSSNGICMVHTHGYRADVVGSGAARALGVGTITTVHGFTGGGIRNRIYEWAQRRTFRKFDSVVAVSRKLSEELRGEGVPETRLHTIPNSRRPPTNLLGRVEARRALSLPETGFQVGWIGRLSPEKGPDVMLEALALIKGELSGQGVAAAFLGDGRLRSALEERSGTLGLEDSVHWLGPVADAAEFFRAFDVVVLSSRTEGTPIVALEAMMAGVPLVATRVGGVPDLMGSGAALLVAPESPRDLARAIEDVYRDPEEARRRSERARDRARQVAAPDAWAEEYLQVYRGVKTTLDRGKQGT